MWKRFSVIRACTAPLAVGAPASVCSIPDARYCPPGSPGWLIGLTPDSVARKPLVALELTRRGRRRSTIEMPDVSMGSRISLRCAISWSERMITGVCSASAMLKAATVTWNVSATLVGASTGRAASPCAENTAWNRSDCSLLVGIPVAGPPRWTLAQTRGSSAMVARPSISVISDMPGPEVAVIALRPANDAPMAAPTPAISSSACRTAPPNFHKSRPSACMISVEGVMG